MAKSRETALYYDPEGGERAQQVKTVLVCMGARIRNIAAADFAQTVGFALGRAGFAQSADTAEAERAIWSIGIEFPFLFSHIVVLDGFTSKRLDVLLRELRQHGVSVPYKAIVTEHNLPWTLRALYDELVREHEAMHG